MKYALRAGLGLAVTLGSHLPLWAQVNPAYEVATWRQFKPAAISYTLDDNTSNQLPVGLPLFDQYGFKTTLFTVTNWGPNWAGLRTASANGHEVTSHTVTHPSLGTLAVAQQLTELQQSQATIKANVPTAKCETVAYPNCVLGDVPTIQAYYLAGRVCSGQIVASSPTDFYNISSIITGSAGSIQTATAMNGRVDAAKAAKGWCVFLTHAIDNDGGYSPTSSTELAAHLAYVNTNLADFWVATFSDVVKYIKERNALLLTETSVSATELSLVPTDNLPDAVYNVPVTVRRQLPTGWAGATVTVGGTAVASSISTINGAKYLTFNVVPDQGAVRLASTSVVTSARGASQAFAASAWPNPFGDKSTLEVPGAFSYSVYALDGKLVETGQGLNTLKFGSGLPAGTYVVKLTQNGRTVSLPVSKK